ncbi:hypothetical protein Acsp04_47540 [Actinomadura sp. NBRC 104425]|uniref:hypothetical protein n=1 Tax=Actinomadura sp. NBRC 104425 TaxID=3032204 RepID=UPI0024A172A9|nr:hypothetical protein [Actinomadura sp. NBRC 104425]GLZ14519.1 hypothetical protein Acsp04_47540 [Actinomadura sp. NBRC 104425]
MIVLAGEDANDRQCMRLLLEELCPDMRGRLVEINWVVRLRQASDSNLAQRIKHLGGLARAKAAQQKAELACVFVHEDFDAADSDEYPKTRDRVQKALESEFGNAHYVLAVAEIEAWLLLFPDALAAFSSSWKLPTKYRGKDTGKIVDPKKVMSEVSRGRSRYRESDAPKVLAKAIELGCYKRPVGSNRSWREFGDDVTRCCTGHLRSNKG